MTVRMSLLPIAAIALILLPQLARADVAGQPCTMPGATKVSGDQRNMLACLQYGAHSLVWTPLASTAVYGNRSPGTAASAAPSPESQATAKDAHSRWQGWYIGGNAGYANTANRFNDVSTNVGGSASPVDLDMDGGTAGLVGGYNWVTNNGLSYGAEADINYMSNAQHLQYMDGITASPAVAKSVWSGYATMRGRLGFAFDPGLIFLTGGLAVVDVRDTYSVPSAAPVITGFSQGGIDVGWTAGAGAEFALTRRISISAEYLRLQIPTSSNSNASDNGAPLKFHLDDSANIVRVAVKWHLY